MRERHIKDFPVSEKPGERTVVRCHVSYSKGGINVWTYKNERRGYWLHVQPMVLEQRDGYSVQRFVPMSGRKMFLLEAKRYSDKGLQEAHLLGQEKLLDPVVAGFIEECVRVPVEA